MQPQSNIEATCGLPEEMVQNKPPGFSEREHARIPFPRAMIQKPCVEAKPKSTNRVQPPYVDIQLHQSAFGLGLMHDRLTLKVNGRSGLLSVSPTIVLAFVEGVLGYQSVSIDTNGRFWHYRKDMELKT